jgi:membrane peptidoglycan carboxypeptidase
MKRLVPVLGALVLVAAVVAVVVWQRSDTKAAPLPPSGDVVLQYTDGTQLWRLGEPETPLIKQVAAELVAKAGMTLDQLRESGGAIVVTTIDPKAQSGAVEAIRTVADGQPASLRYSITAVDPNNGSIRAYAPGNDPAVDYAGGVLKEPGQAFFPFNVVAALQAGKTLDVREALVKSDNAVMRDLVNDVGIKPVITAARQAGVPESVDIDGKKAVLLAGEAGVAMGGSEARMRPLDLAASYATFAAGGMRHDAHFVTHITNVNGDTLYRALPTGKPAFDPDPARSKDIANQITGALGSDPACGEQPTSADTVCRHGEWKLNGQEQVAHAWMVTYNPQISVSAFVGGDQATTPALDREGKAVVGSGLPKQLWTAFEEKMKRW